MHEQLTGSTASRRSEERPFGSFDTLGLLRYASGLDLGSITPGPGSEAGDLSDRARDLARRMALEAGGRPRPEYHAHDVAFLASAGETLVRQATAELGRPGSGAATDERQRLELGHALLRLRDRVRRRLS